MDKLYFLKIFSYSMDSFKMSLGSHKLQFDFNRHKSGLGDTKRELYIVNINFIWTELFNI